MCVCVTTGPTCSTIRLNKLGSCSGKYKLQLVLQMPRADTPPGAFISGPKSPQQFVFIWAKFGAGLNACMGPLFAAFSSQLSVFVLSGLVAFKLFLVTRGCGNKFWRLSYGLKCLSPPGWTRICVALSMIFFFQLLHQKRIHCNSSAVCPTQLVKPDQKKNVWKYHNEVFFLAHKRTGNWWRWKPVFCLGLNAFRIWDIWQIIPWVRKNAEWDINLEK